MLVEIKADGLHLIFAGILLFVIGLFQGVAIPMFKNSRMGLSAHLTAVQSGTAIMVIGVVWSLVVLPLQWMMIAKLSLIAGSYLIWVGMTAAAMIGASKALPIAGKGFAASRGRELAVSACICVSVGLLLLSGTLMLFGLGRTVFGIN